MDSRSPTYRAPSLDDCGLIVSPNYVEPSHSHSHADDHPSIRKAVKLTLEEQPGFEICAVVEDGRRAVEEASRLKPDVTILNVTMPHMNGLDAARLIKAERPETAIVILSSHADQEFLTIAKDIGVRSYVAKMKAGQELVNAVQAAVRGEDYYVLD